MFGNLIKNMFGDPYADLVEEAKAKGDKYYIAGGDFGMEDAIFSGKTKEETVENAYNTLKASTPDILESMRDFSNDPVEQEKYLKQSLDALMEEIQ